MGVQTYSQHCKRHSNSFKAKTSWSSSLCWTNNQIPKC